MAIVRNLLLVAVGAALCASCSGKVVSGEEPNVGVDGGEGGFSSSGGSGGATPDAGESVVSPYIPPGNGVPMSEMDACESLLASMADNAARLGCLFTAPGCPSYIHGAGAPVCSAWDEGTISACADYYDTFQSCADYAAKACRPTYIGSSAPAGCKEIDDAGADGPADECTAEYPDICGACVASACCQEYTACLNDSGCVAVADCYTSCLWDSYTCATSCNQDDQNVAFTDLFSCMAGSCADDCIQ